MCVKESRKAGGCMEVRVGVRWFFRATMFPTDPALLLLLLLLLLRDSQQLNAETQAHDQNQILEKDRIDPLAGVLSGNDSQEDAR